MIHRLKAEWHALRHDRPGHRFQARYDRAARHRRGSGWVMRALNVGAAIVAIAIGLAEVVFPGPAILFFAVGGALLAAQSRTIARALDWLELRLRGFVRFVWACWGRCSRAARTAIIASASVVALAAGYLTVHLLGD